MGGQVDLGQVSNSENPELLLFKEKHMIPSVQATKSRKKVTSFIVPYLEFQEDFLLQWPSDLLSYEPVVL